MADFTLGQGDLGPVLEASPVLPDGTLAALDGADLQFFMAPYGSALPAVGTAVIVLPDPVTPRLQHEWLEEETADFGTFWFQIRGTLGDGKPYTFPTVAPGYYTLEIWPKV